MKPAPPVIRMLFMPYFGVRRQSAAATALWISVRYALVCRDPSLKFPDERQRSLSDIQRRRRCALPADSKFTSLHRSTSANPNEMPTPIQSISALDYQSRVLL